MLIELNNVAKQYGRGENAVHALKNISLMIDQNEFVAIMGKSGCGKTTLINIMATIFLPDSGTYHLDGRAVNEFSEPELAVCKRRTVAVVFPKRMQANTIIEYVSDSEYIILQGGIPTEGLYNENGLTEEEQRIVDERNRRIREEMPDIEIIRLEDSVPISGMRVYYDANGCIEDIKTPFSLYHYDDDNYDPLPRGTTLKPGSYSYGIYDSTIVITNTRVSGRGQIIMFSDSIGEADNILKKR